MEHYYSFAKREHLFTKEEIGKMIGNFLQQSLPAASIGVFFFTNRKNIVSSCWRNRSVASRRSRIK